MVSGAEGSPRSKVECDWEPMGARVWAKIGFLEGVGGRAWLVRAAGSVRWGGVRVGPLKWL